MFFLDKLKLDKPNLKFLVEIFKKPIFKNSILSIFFTAILFVTVIDSVSPDKISVNVGDMAPRDIRASKDIIDEEETIRVRQEAMDRILPKYKIDPSIQVKVKNIIKNYFDIIENIQSKGIKDVDTQIFTINISSELKLSDDYYNAIALKLSSESLTKLEGYIYDILNQIMNSGITNDDIESIKLDVSTIFNDLDDLSQNERELGIKIINTTLKPNKFLDEKITQELKNEAAKKINPVIIEERQIIVRKGDKIDLRAYNLIKSSGLLKEISSFEYKKVLGSLMIIILLEIILIGYLIIFNKDLLNSPKIYILAIITIGVIIISKSMNTIDGYLMPIATATMLISIIISPKLALLLNLIITIIVGVITGSDINVIILLLVGGSIGALGAIKTSQRYNILLMGFLISLANIITIISLGLIEGNNFNYIFSKSVYGGLNGLFSSILTIGSLPLWESIFGIVTPLKLLELSNPNQALLKKLLLEAPGTYHHSIIVGNLSEAAAEAIKANPLIARVGAYYHDVGKLKRPYLFKENQMGGENPHDKLKPNLSTLIITNHVKHGVELANKYKLPWIIKDIIKQHHGTTLVAFFYHKALNGENPDLVQEESFRYEGPKPQSKEAAIIMIADSVEAAVRSMVEPSKGKIEGLVRKIIQDKLKDGQLDECDLTLKELNTIANSFLNVLTGIFHERIEYPDLDIKELKEVE